MKNFFLHLSDVTAMKCNPRMFMSPRDYFPLLFSVNPPGGEKIVSLSKVLTCCLVHVLSSQVCMDILCNIVRCTQPPLSEPLLNSVFPVVVNTILASDDNSVLQVQTWAQNISHNHCIVMGL